MPRLRKEVSEAQKRIILEDYAKGDGMLKIGDKLNHNVVVIRRVLIEEGVVIRHVGRPRNED